MTDRIFICELFLADFIFRVDPYDEEVAYVRRSSYASVHASVGKEGYMGGGVSVW